MFLKSLELNGFKSFAQKTIFDLGANITAIVGPNGSGKSNIIDAIRWLLGEREAKNLRGGKAEDLIYSGTEKRPKMGMAKASLYFNNESGFFPVDFKEVSLERRVTRDGNSEYFLNKSEVRLKDIIDFLSSSRLGTKGLIIINQGNSDLFVKAAPEERRVMIEEILGLREYELKKLESERKLKNTNINLEKIKAKIEEILPHLRSLKRQTSKWSKRGELEKELEELENRYFSFKLGEIQKGVNDVVPVLDDLENRIAAKTKELKSLQGELAEVENRSTENTELKSIKKNQGELQTEYSRTQKELGRLEAKIEYLSAAGDEGETFKNEELVGFLKSIKNSLEDGISRSDFNELQSLVKNLLANINQFLGRSKKESGANELAEAKKLKDEMAKKMQIVETEIKKSVDKESKIASGLEDFNKSFWKAFKLVEAKKEEINKLDSQKNKVLFEKEKFNLKLDDLREQLSQIGRKMEEISAVKFTQIEAEALHEMDRRILRIRGELASIGDVDETLIKEFEETEKHYNFLSGQVEDLEKASTDLRELIKELREKIHLEFNSALHSINEEFNKFFHLMFGGGSAKLKIFNIEKRVLAPESASPEGTLEEGDSNGDNEVKSVGLDIVLKVPKKRITSLESLSGGEKSLVSIAALFAMISVSPPPFLVLDEVDAALDESNSARFSSLVKGFSGKTQFIIVTHNRKTMEVADVLYGISMNDDGTSKVLSLKLEA